MEHSWIREAWVLAGMALAGLFFAIFLGHPLVFLVLALVAGCIRSLFLLRGLHRWVTSYPRGPAPDLPGVWGQIAHETERRERGMERRRDRVVDILERFRRLSAAVPDAMVVLSQENQIEWLNPAAERLLGLRSARDQGARIVNLVRSPDFQDYLHTGDFSNAFPLTTSNERQLSVQIVPFDESLKLLIGRDITHLARLHGMRQEFVANVSHELRTPLTVLSGFLETLRDLPPGEVQDLRPHFELMHEQAQRMQRLIDDLLTLSRLETEPPTQEEVVDVAALLGSLERLGTSLTAGAGPRIEIEADAGLRLVGNTEELRSAFSNLLSNALRHTPSTGHIRLRWGREQEEPRLWVEDTGEGIAAQHIPHLTERFYRVDTARSRTGGGTGLGLSIVKHILHRHQAHLLIESQLGKGSRFGCAFPSSRAVVASQI